VPAPGVGCVSVEVRAMTGFLAVGLIASFFIGFRTLFAIMRSPACPAWLRWDLVGELLAVALVGTLALGMALAIVEIGTFATTGPTIGELVAIAAAAGIAALAWRVLPRLLGARA
jgi:hypothetical protein